MWKCLQTSCLHQWRNRCLSTSSSANLQRTTKLYARGSGLYGALGLGDNLRNQPYLQEISLPDINEVPIKVGAGWAHSIALTESGQAYVWGRPHDFTNILRLNRIEKLSKGLALLAAKASNSFVFGDVFGYYPKPTLLGDMPPIASVTCSAGLSILLSKTGELYSFGFNRWEQCGIPNHKKDILEQPQRVLGLSSCHKVDAGLQHVIALTTSGQVIGWGKCNKGQLGFGRTEITHNAPVQIPIKEEVIDISTGFLHSAAVTVQGHVYVWGKGMSEHIIDKMGMLKVADIAWEPRKIILPQGLQAVEVCCSNFAVIIRANNGSLWVIGMGEHDRNANPIPIPVASDYSPVVSSTASSSTSSTSSILDSNTYLLRKGQQRVSVHTNRDCSYQQQPTGSNPVDSETDGQLFRSFEIILHKGEAYLHPLRMETAENQIVPEIVEYSSGWKHDLVIASTAQEP